MERRQLGASPVSVSVLGLGCTNFGPLIDAAESERVVDAALDAGITHFDTADIYGLGSSEEILGRALGRRRSQAVIATKFSCPMGPDTETRGASARYVRQACEASLRRLGTDHIDLYWLHYPDPDTPIEETLGALGALIEAGKVRAVGCSNFAGWQVAEAAMCTAGSANARFAATQVEWSLLNRSAEAEVIPACDHFGLATVAYSPLAFGLLTGKYTRGSEPPVDSRLARQVYARSVASEYNFDRVEALNAVARDAGYSLLDLALAWLAARPGLASIVAAATRPAQVVANVAAVNTPIDAAVLASVDEVVAAPPAQPRPPSFDSISRGARPGATSSVAAPPTERNTP